MATVNLSPIGNGFQFFDNNGLPLNAGKIYTYQAGSTTPLTTYTDSAGLVANANPIILGTDGRPPAEIWLVENYFYKFVLTTSADVTIQTFDNLYGIIGTAPAAATPIPSGCIILWSGSIGSIPSGWVLCNGSNGTPDLRDRFVVGAGSSYAVDGTGGSKDAVVVAHTHDERIYASGAETAGYGLTVTSAFVDRVMVVDTDPGTGPDGRLTASAGVSGTNANLPPYYALCYIMKT